MNARAQDVSPGQRTRRITARLLPAGALALLGAQLLPAAAWAQEDPRIEQLQRQIEALQRQLDDLKGEVENRMPPPPERPPQAAGEPVVSGNDKIQLSISGQVDRALLISDDSHETNLFFVDNDNASSRLHFEGTGELNDDLTVGAVIEAELQSNSTRAVNQADQSTGAVSFEERKVEVYFASGRFGKVWLGHGSTASDDSAEVDLSGTGVVGTSDIGDFAGGLLFVEGDTLSAVSIADAFSNYDGLGRDDRLRYDTPRFGGFALATSAASDSNFDVAGSYTGAFGDTKLAGAAAFASNAGDWQQVDGSASLLLAGGFNATAAAGWRDTQGRYVYGKLGYRLSPFSFGGTALAVDAYYGEDIARNGDDSWMFGLLAVQTVDQIATDLYFGYRHFDLSRNGADFDPINAALSGARIKF